MNNKLYKLMNWPVIESVIYKECTAPHDVLGVHRVGNQSLVQAFFPDAKSVSVHWNSTDKGTMNVTTMELADADGFFACLIPATSIKKYFYCVTDSKGVARMVNDAYSFEQSIPQKEVLSLTKGINYSAFDIMGAHTCELEGINGCSFTVWAPEALGVSVVGDFNGWDGRVHQMRKLNASDVFEIFIPDVEIGSKYKYEIRCKGGRVVLKGDPYGFATEKIVDGASIVCAKEDFCWTDENFLSNRAKENAKPFSVYRFCPQAFKERLDDSVEYNWKLVIDHLTEHVKTMGYTHVELTPIQSYIDEASYGFDTVAYYSCDNGIASASEIKELVNRLHNIGVGVFLDWNAVGFDSDSSCLSDFVGNHLYEYGDPLKTYIVGTGKKQFDFGRSEVSDYLLANAFYWIEEFHFDGLRVSSLDACVYLDYGRLNDHSVNIYGGVENLEAIEFIKHLNSMMEKRNPGVVMIADSYAYPGVTEPLDQDGLGFDMKLNYGFATDYRDYIKQDPLYRGSHHDSLTASTVYANAEKYILSFNPEAAWGSDGFEINGLTGSEEQRRSDYRLSLAHLYAHPGRKMLNMSQDSVIGDEGIAKLVKDLNTLYSSESALHSRFHESDCFEWIDNLGREKCYISYIRKGISDTNLIIVVANFSGIELNTRVGVPFEGKYKEVINTDNQLYGGNGTINPRVKLTADIPCDGRNQSIQLRLAPRSMGIFKFTSYTEEELKKVIEERVRKNLPVHKKSSVSKTKKK